MAASFFVLVLGFFAAFCYTLYCRQEVVFLSPFLTWWFAFSCFFGGFATSARTRATPWKGAAKLGLFLSCFILFFCLALFPVAPGVLEVVGFFLCGVFLSCAGSLAGTNWSASRETLPGRRSWKNYNHL
ncbi:MAG TPA: hypothetical protein DCE07_05230 [Peptococcaceae bacterium]|nr:hypothetical protein [Peptococcaceae bacterium]